MSRTLRRGFSDEFGSWNTACTAPAEVAEPPLGHGGDVLAVEDDAPARRRQEPQDQPPDRPLAAAALADHAERLARGDVEAHVVDRAQRRPRGRPANCREVSEPSTDRSGRRPLARRDTRPQARAASTSRPITLAGAPAADPPVGSVGVERRRRLAAERDRVGAARMEAAAAGKRGRRRHAPGDRRTAARASRGPSARPRAAAAYTGDAARGRAPRRAPPRRPGPHTSRPPGRPCAAITPISWVISRIAVPAARPRSRIRARICAWIVTSSAVVGSSAIRRRGRQAIAIAIITRWRMPPES